MTSLSYFANGQFAVKPNEEIRVEAAAVVQNEDWKTAFARGQKPIPAGTTGTMTELMKNFYGVYARVSFDTVDYSVYVKTTQLNHVGPFKPSR